MSRAERVVLRRDGVPISSLALGWRNILSSKSPFASMLISYSLSRALLNRIKQRRMYVHTVCGHTVLMTLISSEFHRTLGKHESI